MEKNKCNKFHLPSWTYIFGLMFSCQAAIAKLSMATAQHETKSCTTAGRIATSTVTCPTDANHEGDARMLRRTRTRVRHQREDRVIEGQIRDRGTLGRVKRGHVRAHNATLRSRVLLMMNTALSLDERGRRGGWEVARDSNVRPTRVHNCHRHYLRSFRRYNYVVFTLYILFIINYNCHLLYPVS